MTTLFPIRPWQEADLTAVIELFQQTVHTTGSKYYRQDQLQAWAPQKGDTAAWLESLRGNKSYVAEVDGTIVAFGDMTLTGHIERVYVLPKYQGQGIALAFMKRFEEEARRLGVKTITTDASVIAMPLLKRFGFVVVQEYCKTHRGVEFTNYLMEKKLLSDIG